MSFAPYSNQDVHYQILAGNPDELPLLVGSFKNSETGAQFEYGLRPKAERQFFASEMPHVIYLTNNETRFAKILKTVAYVVVDEDADGLPVVEKWEIKSHRQYDTSWVGV